MEAGIRRELKEARQIVEPEPTSWQEAVDQFRARLRAARAEKGEPPKSKEEIIDELRAIRREIWEEEYQARYTGHGEPLFFGMTGNDCFRGGQC